MNDQLHIKSTKSVRELVISNIDASYKKIELRGDIEASIRLYEFSPGSDDLPSWFDRLGALKEPWKDELAWESLEGELKIVVTCTSLGTVKFDISLRDSMGEGFFVQADIQTELGQLEKISDRARAFFGRKST